MQLRKATTFIVSTASFFLASNVAATSLRGVGEAVEFEDDILAEEKAGTFLLVSDTMIAWSPLMYCNVFYVFVQADVVCFIMQ